MITIAPKQTQNMNKIVKNSKKKECIEKLYRGKDIKK